MTFATEILFLDHVNKPLSQIKYSYLIWPEKKNTQWGKFSAVSMFLYLNMNSTFFSTSDRQKTIFLLCQYILIPQIKSMVKANNT